MQIFSEKVMNHCLGCLGLGVSVRGPGLHVVDQVADVSHHHNLRNTSAVGCHHKNLNILPPYFQDNSPPYLCLLPLPLYLPSSQEEADQKAH